MLFATLLKEEVLTIIMICVCIIPILVLAVWAVVATLKNKKKIEESRDKIIESEGPDLEQKKVFEEAYGGSDNILEVSNEMTRLIVKVKDIEKVLPENLKELGAINVLLVGDVVKCSYGDRAPYIYKLMEK